MSKSLRIVMCMLVALCASVCGFAQDESTTQKYLVVDFKDERTVEFELADKPVLTFADSKFTVTEGTEVTSYDFDTVVGYHFTSTPTDIGTATKGSLSVRFTDNETIVIEGNEAFSASVYDTAGRAIDSQSTAGGSVSLSLAGQPQGVYVVKVSDGKSFKLLKK